MNLDIYKLDLVWGLEVIIFDYKHLELYDINLCYNLGATIVAMAVMVLGSLFFIFSSNSSKDSKVVSFVILGAATMQIGELLMHIDENCSTGLNEIGSYLGYFSLLVIQPFFSLIGAYLYNEKEEDTKGMCKDFILMLRKFLPYVWIVVAGVWFGYFSWKYFPKQDDTYFSKDLNQTVSVWCTTDKTCADDMCDLDWKWDDLNRDERYWPYWTLVFLIPALTLRRWVFWTILSAVPFRIIEWVNGGNNSVANASASCFWGPLAALLIAGVWDAIDDDERRKLRTTYSQL